MLDTTTEAPAATTADSDSLVHDHLHLVQHVVNQLANGFPRHVDRSEMWSAGAYGLVDAARRYDPSTGVPFPRYANIRIRGAIIDSTRTRDIATRRLRRDLREMNVASERFEAERGRTPDEVELAEMLKIDTEEVVARRAAAVATTVLQLDMPMRGADGAGNGTLADGLVEKTADVLPEFALENAELIGTLRDAVSHLDDIHREVIERHFFEGDLLRDIGADMGCTEARISQLRSEALHSLQAVFGGLYDGVPEVPETAPGMRRRASYVATVAAQSTWRTRMDAAALVPAATA